MIDAKPVAEDTAQTCGYLLRQHYFRQKHQHLTAWLHNVLYQMYVNLGLAARRDTVKQHRVLSLE